MPDELTRLSTISQKLGAAGYDKTQDPGKEAIYSFRGADGDILSSGTLDALEQTLAPITIDPPVSEMKTVEEKNADVRDLPAADRSC